MFNENQKFISIIDPPCSVRLIKDNSNQLGLNQIYIEVTKACNLNCFHCYNDSKLPTTEELSLLTIKSIVDQAVELNVERICLSGGEPLMRNDIIDIIEYMAHKNIKVELYSNGTTLNEEKIRILKDIVSNFNISVDGCSPETVNKHRGSFDAYSKIMSSLYNLKKYNTNVDVLISVNELNKKEIVPLFNSLKSKYKPNFRLYKTIACGRFTNQKRMMISDKEFSDIIFSLFVISTNEEDYVFNIPPCPKSNQLFINHEGFTTDCFMIPHEFEDCRDFGNVKNSNIINIWERIIASDIHNVLCKKTKECSMSEFCNNGCRARSYYEYGNINAPDITTCKLIEKFINEGYKFNKTFDLKRA